MISPAIELCSDEELGYERSRTGFVPGEGLALDDVYRLAHLPLVAPDHPKVIPSREGAAYSMGRHPRVYSLAVPLPTAALLRSAAFLELDRALRASPFSRKIAWSLLERRKDRLHATICGSLAVGQDKPPTIGDFERRELKSLGPIAIELRGLFSGNVNIGRLYLRVYPEQRDGANLLKKIQRTLGRRETDLYVVGVYNLTDDLDPPEAAALAGLIEHWWDRPLLRFQVDSLWLLGAMDDLVLDGEIAELVSLV
ncbi:hypothetical protein GCM10011611_24790 [Aliidongia dinghuensis]|uniref:Uncharacterized protein n=1 Tax=Aliidongia dinghuensis TaxID=1867774 RepID=A0A8J2YU16_9PROT|nr:hypothetical protein [Aliidongia dinghuensis]GGF17982.1 hypothetical protein GCM10011611_24790 [Aliidongia dinghuensis]